jgi:hypothetical protein
MDIIAHNQNLLILRFQRSFCVGLAIGISCAVSGGFFALFGLLMAQKAEAIWILPFVMGNMMLISSFISVIKYPQITTLTFDQAQQRMVGEKYLLRFFQSQPARKTIEIPMNLIMGIEIVTSSDMDTATGYYSKLILNHVYERFLLDSYGAYRSTVSTAEAIAQFLNIAYFPDESKAPTPTRFQNLPRGEIGLEGWRGLDDRIEYLRQSISESSPNAEIHQELGLLLFRTERSDLKEAAMHFQQAELLFEAGQERDRAVLAKVLRELVEWERR